MSQSKLPYMQARVLVATGRIASALLSSCILHFFTFQVVLITSLKISRIHSAFLQQRTVKYLRHWDIYMIVTWFNGELCCSPTLMTFEAVFPRLVMSSTLCYSDTAPDSPFPKQNTRVERSDDLCKCLRQEVGSWTPPHSAFVKTHNWGTLSVLWL